MVRGVSIRRPIPNAARSVLGPTADDAPKPAAAARRVATAGDGSVPYAARSAPGAASVDAGSAAALWLVATAGDGSVPYAARSAPGAASVDAGSATALWLVATAGDGSVPSQDSTRSASVDACSPTALCSWPPQAMAPFPTQPGQHLGSSLCRCLPREAHSTATAAERARCPPRGPREDGCRAQRCGTWWCRTYAPASRALCALRRGSGESARFASGAGSAGPQQQSVVALLCCARLRLGATAAATTASSACSERRPCG